MAEQDDRDSRPRQLTEEQASDVGRQDNQLQTAIDQDNAPPALCQIAQRTSSVVTPHTSEAPPLAMVRDINVGGSNNPMFFGPATGNDFSQTLNQFVVIHKTADVQTLLDSTNLSIRRLENLPSSLKPTTQEAATPAREYPTSKELIKDRVHAAADSCEGELKMHYKSTGSYVKIIPWIDDQKRHVTDIYTRLQLEIEGKTGCILESYEDIFLLKTKEGESITLAVLVGLPGRGKSTLVDKMAYDWAVGVSQVLRKYKLVFVLKMSALEQSSDLIDAIFDQLLAEDTCVKKEALKQFIEKEPERVLILLDGFDELMTTSNTGTSVGSIFKILNRRRCRGCCVIVTTRPSHFERLVTNQLVQRPFTHITVLGFSEDDVKEYVDKFFSYDTYVEETLGLDFAEHERVQGLLERIDSSAVLSDLAQSPMLLLLMCLLWRENFTLPETMSRLYCEAVRYIFKRKVDVTQEKILEIVTGIGKVGLHGLLSPDQILSLKEGNFAGSLLDSAIKVGILTRHRVIKRLDAHNSVQFIHKSFQEFCAAKYLQSLLEGGKAEFQESLDEIMSKDPLVFEYLLRFSCGDNEACTNRILLSFAKRYTDNSLSVNEKSGQVAIICYYEGQLEALPPVEFIDSLIREEIFVGCFPNCDCLYSFVSFMKHVVDQSKDQGNPYLSKVKRLLLESGYLGRFAADFSYFMRAMTNLEILQVCLCSLDVGNVQDIVSALSSVSRLTELSITGMESVGGSLASWLHHLRHLRNLKVLNLAACALMGKDVEHIGESLGNLPNLVELDLRFNAKLGGSVGALWSSLKKLSHLQKLSLCDCSLTAEDVKHIAESLRDLPSLLELDLSFNGKLHESAAASWFSLRHLQFLKKLDLSCCSLTGGDAKHVAKSLSKLPNLEELNLSRNPHLSGSVSLWVVPLQNLKHLRNLDLRSCSLEYMDKQHLTELLRDLSRKGGLLL